MDSQAPHPLLGMPTLIELPDLPANADLCRRLGLSFVELNMNGPQFLPEALPVETLAALRRETGVSFSIHLPEELDLGSFHREIRDGHVACIAGAMDWARRASIDRLTMHLNPGVYFTLPEGRVWLYSRHRAAYLANLTGSFRRVLPAGGDATVRLLIENTGRFGLDFMQEAAERLLGQFGESLALTWDVGHDAAAGYCDTRFMHRHAARVAEVHLHDFDGRSSHRPLFTGTVDIAASLAFARQRGVPIVLETKTASALEASVRALRDRGLA